MARTQFYKTNNLNFGRTEDNAIAVNNPQRLTPPVASPFDIRGQTMFGVETDDNYKTSIVNVGYLDEQLVNQSIEFKPNTFYNGTAGSLVSYRVTANKYDFYVIVNNQRFLSGSTPVSDVGNFLRLPLDSFYVDHYEWKDDQSFRTGDLITHDNRTYITLEKHVVPKIPVTGSPPTPVRTLDEHFISYYGHITYRLTFNGTPIVGTNVVINGVTISEILDTDTQDDIAQKWSDAYNELVQTYNSSNPDRPNSVVGSENEIGIPDNTVSIVNVIPGVDVTAVAVAINGITVASSGGITDLLQLLSNQATWQPLTRYFPGDIVVFQEKIYVAKASLPEDGFTTGTTFNPDNWIFGSDSKIISAENLDAVFSYNNLGFVDQIRYGNIDTNTGLLVETSTFDVPEITVIQSEIDTGELSVASIAGDIFTYTLNGITGTGTIIRKDDTTATITDTIVLDDKIIVTRTRNALYAKTFQYNADDFVESTRWYEDAIALNFRLTQFYYDSNDRVISKDIEDIIT